MQGPTVKYQLRRMVLVNVGTNKLAPSARITAIDPRGGAAVLGDNGVGKTTTLRILPLFFGHLPSQIVSGGQGLQSMIRFVLPTDSSAIAFEYQRGSDKEEDLRMVVIRRRSDDPDVPFYRLYSCGFRKELFVGEGRFLDDEESQKKASELGIVTSSKLSTAEYRSVILRTPASSKERDKLRRYSVEWSFGLKSLDNLDRLVAAMVKKHINFADIVQVAVGLVQQDLGHGAERAKLVFKQGRAPIERWLRNREACVEAFKLESRVGQLEDELKAHRAGESRFRALRADVAAVHKARGVERAEVSRAIERLTEEHQAVLEQQALQRAQLSQAAGRASSDAAAARTTYDEQHGLAQHFETNRAAHWEAQTQRLPGLRQSKQTAEQRVTAAEAEHAEASALYAKAEQEAITRSGQATLALEQGKQPHRERLAQARELIRTSEETARQEARALRDARREELQQGLQPLYEQRGHWEGRKNAPAASEQALHALEQAREQAEAHQTKREKAHQALNTAREAEQLALRAFATQEDAIRKAREEVARADAAVKAAQLRLTPTAGTLLAALRSSTSQAWKHDLAKVLNPELLERDELDPQLLEEAVQTLYGWRLNTGVLPTPEWSDDERARAALEDAQTRHAAAEANLGTQQDALGAKSQALETARGLATQAEANAGILDEQAGALRLALEKAKHQVEKEKRESASKADEVLQSLKVQIDGINTQLKVLDTELARQEVEITQQHKAQRVEAQALHDQAIASIDASIASAAEELAATVAGIRAQLAQHLESKGVNVATLQALKDQAKVLAVDVRELEDKLPLVERWQAWNAEGGAARVESLRTAVVQAQESARQHAQKLTEFDQAALKAKQAHDETLSTKEKRLADIDDDIKVLTELDEVFDDYMALGESVVDTATPARELRGRVTAARGELDKAKGAISKHASTIRTALTAKENLVRELVEASLDKLTSADDVTRASELCSCYKNIGPHVANDVNLTLKTLLTNIGQFQKSIQSFEREVSAFNRRLKAGLSEVRCFERIKDLELDIITNFENLGFYKKLSRMDEVVRRHANEFGKDNTRELPPDETARALGDFMQVLSADGNMEVNLSSHITLKGSVTDNGQRKEFKRASELENISSEGLTSLVLITLMTALLNTIRGGEPVHVPWVTDEVGKFDPTNFASLMLMLRDNRIDVVTASPELGPSQQALFARRYLFEDRGRIREYQPASAPASALVDQAPALEVSA